MSHHPVVVMMECDISCWMLWCCVLMVVMGCGYFDVLVIGCGGGAMWWWWCLDVVVGFDYAVYSWMWWQCLNVLLVVGCGGVILRIIMWR